MPKVYHDELFSFSIEDQQLTTFIKMKVHPTFAYTDNFPQTYEVLKQYFPSVLLAKCFNRKRLPFAQEVKDTELGHLFEHLILENLYRIRLSQSVASPVYKGVTEWDWNREPRGTFNITLHAGFRDAEILPRAINKSVELLKKVISPISVADATHETPTDSHIGLPVDIVL
ncbi:MAG: hypothetical protein NUV69_04725 [Candidatus Curtissbacteria bacterium]|nr:hypothetical protein [Candidatus Curtissbacteria bacterium]